MTYRQSLKHHLEKTKPTAARTKPKKRKPKQSELVCPGRNSYVPDYITRLKIECRTGIRDLSTREGADYSGTVHHLTHVLMYLEAVGDD